MKMENNNWFIGATLLALVLPFSAYAAFTSSEWQWMKPITIPQEAVFGDAYVKINLDQESNIFSAPGLPDLRVVLNGTEEVPYQIVSESKQEGKQFAGATILSRMIDDGDTIVIVDVGPSGLRHNAIDVQSPTPNFRRQVSVYSSEVLLDWADPKWGWINPSSRDGVLVRSTDAFMYHFSDYELGFNAGSGTVYYPETSSRYLRVVIHKENEKKEAISISGVQVYRDIPPSLREDELQVVPSIEENSKAQSTEIVIDLGGGGLPTKAVTLNVSGDENYSRRATIHGSKDGAQWVPIGQGYLFNVNTPSFSGTELTLRYPEVTYRYLRVVVFNDDNKPLQFVSSLLLRSTLRSIVFSGKEQGTYALYYGNSLAKTPRYDLSRYFQYIESVSIPRAALGVQKQNSMYAPAAPIKQPLADEYPQLVNITLVILVVLATLLLLAYVKKLKLEKPHDAL